MNYYLNQSMMEIIRKTPYKKVSLSYNIKRIIDEGFVVDNSCVFFSYFKKANPHLTEYLFEDKTHWEHTMNGFHLEDYCRKPTINHVFCLVNKLNKLIKDYSCFHPIIYISYDNGNYHFSFTTKHSNEKLWITPDDLNSYSQAILIIEL